MKSQLFKPIVGSTMLVLAFAAAALTTDSAFAHHAFSMFDRAKTMTIEGKVKEFQWTNPHTWVQVLVTQEDGTVVEWSIEGSSPNGLRRRGWRSDSIKTGDEVKVLINPLKNGDPGGSLVNITLPDGTVLGRNVSPQD